MGGMASADPTLVLIVDDHEVVRDGLIATLASDERRVLGVATAEEAQESLGHERPDVVIVDLRLPGMSGHELIGVLREEHPDLGIIVLSTHLSEQSVRAAYDAGADAYVAKSAGSKELRTALDAVLQGHTREESPTELVRRLRGGAPLVPQLTTQQERVLSLAAQGATDKEIARTLHISESTVRFHMQRAKELLGARSKTQVIAEAFRRELIAPSAL
jgi:DNA-binding NarL/FixJ family response regulator